MKTKNLPQDRTKIEAELRPKIEQELEQKFAKLFEDEVAKLNKFNQEQISRAIDEWKKEQKPPDPEEIQKLISQEYFEFEMALETADGKRTFTIRELPQAIEKKYYKQVKTALIPHIQEIAGLTIALSDTQGIEEKVLKMLDTFEPLFEILSDLVTLILDPYGKEGIDKAWVQNNLSSFRMWNIVIAQDTANRVRSFFSVASKASLDGKMMGVSIQS